LNLQLLNSNNGKDIDEPKKSKRKRNAPLGSRSVQATADNAVDNSELLALKDKNAELSDENSELRERLKNLMSTIKDKAPSEQLDFSIASLKDAPQEGKENEN